MIRRAGARGSSVFLVDGGGKDGIMEQSLLRLFVVWCGLFPGAAPNQTKRKEKKMKKENQKHVWITDIVGGFLLGAGLDMAYYTVVRLRPDWRKDENFGGGRCGKSL